MSAVELMLPAAGPSWIAGKVWTTVPLRRDVFPPDGCWGGVGEITETRRKHVGSGRICCHLAQVGLHGIRESDV